MATLVSRPTQANLDALTAGALIGGKYKILQQIGRGGFGAVFRCQHIGTGQDVAVKVLALPGGENDGVFQRFFLEARSTAGLGHPNTLRVFDFGQDETGACFLVMELLAGRTLADELRERAARDEVFTEMEALAISDAVLRSLAEAHDKGLIHRDIKPHNIFLHEVQGDDPTVKVLDFGIAHSAELAAQSALTQAGQVLRTPSYMSPEQVQGLPVDRRSDLYSVAVVLYEMVTGATPFAANLQDSTFHKQVHEAPAPLREKARVLLSDPFIAAIERALSKKPENRFNDAASMRQALMGKRGHVSGSQMVVRVSSTSIPQVRVDARTMEAALPQITVNGETVDAASLQPRTTRKNTVVNRPPPQPPTPQQVANRQLLNRLLLWGAIAVILLSFVALALSYQRQERAAEEAAEAALARHAKDAPPEPATPYKAPSPAPASDPEPTAIPEPTIPPPPSFEGRPPRAKGKR